MEVILLNKVENLGELGDKVTVRSGYARNYLIPQGRAKFATAANIAEFEARRAELEAEAAAAIAAATERQASLDGLAITIPAKEASDGKLFGSINNIDVLAAITQAGQTVENVRFACRMVPFVPLVSTVLNCTYTPISMPRLPSTSLLKTSLSHAIRI